MTAPPPDDAEAAGRRRRLHARVRLMIDPVSRTVTATIRHFRERKSPFALAVGARTRTVYTTTYIPDRGASRSVSVIDSVARKVTASIRVRWPAETVAVNPVTHLVYVTHRKACFVSVIDANTHRVTATIHFYKPLGEAANPDSHTVYVGHALGVSVIEPAG
jgi:YVTN family beta-propeller protein